MIVIDANILIYAYDAASSQHVKAHSWLEEIFSGDMSVGLPWEVVSAFLRITTNPKLPGKRFAVQEAIQIVGAWFEQPHVQPLLPTEDHWAVFQRMLIKGQATGNLISDAHLAALTVEFGGVLHTTDRDFTRFPGLRWTNPLD